MCSANQIHVVLCQESRNYVASECETVRIKRVGWLARLEAPIENLPDSSIVFTPPGDILVWVRPKKITKQTCVRHIRWSHNSSDLLHALQIGALITKISSELLVGICTWEYTKTYQSTVHGEDLFVDYSSDRQTVEAIRESFPQLDVISSFAYHAYGQSTAKNQLFSKIRTFIVESIDSVDASTFVVASQDEEVLWVFDLPKERA